MVLKSGLVWLRLLLVHLFIQATAPTVMMLLVVLLVELVQAQPFFRGVPYGGIILNCVLRLGVFPRIRISLPRIALLIAVIPPLATVFRIGESIAATFAHQAVPCRVDILAALRVGLTAGTIGCRNSTMLPMGMHMG